LLREGEGGDFNEFHEPRCFGGCTRTDTLAAIVSGPAQNSVAAFPVECANNRASRHSSHQGYSAFAKPARKPPSKEGESYENRFGRANVLRSRSSKVGKGAATTVALQLFDMEFEYDSNR
jgi:hypothetical protein